MLIDNLAKRVVCLKKIRRLRRKCGFTILELVVVMAIIGILAAILIPTILGMSEKARLASVNSTAANIRKNVDVFLVEADGELYGLKDGASETFYITVSQEGDSVRWSCSAADSNNFFDGGNVSWGSAGSYAEGEIVSNGESLLCERLSEWFPSLKRAFMAITVNSGQCTFVVYSDNLSTVPDSAEYPAPVDGGAPENFAWNEKPGRSSGGYLFGTSPEVPIIE